MERADMSQNTTPSSEDRARAELALRRARRTAFVARFIVLREAKRTRSHRTIETMEWDDETSAEEMYERFRQVFVQNGDNMGPVDRDLRRAMAHASRSIQHFVREYAARSTTNFIDALFDYERSNHLLFGDEEQPKPGGWRLAQELRKSREREAQEDTLGSKP